MRINLRLDAVANQRCRQSPRLWSFQTGSIKCPGYKAAPDKSGFTLTCWARVIYHALLCSPATLSPGGLPSEISTCRESRKHLQCKLIRAHP